MNNLQIVRFILKLCKDYDDLNISSVFEFLRFIYGKVYVM